MTTMQNTEIPRDGYGRPLIMPISGKGRRQPYRRTTTFVGALEDMNGLIRWKARQVAYGMGQRRDLVMAAAATDPDNKTKLGQIAEQASEAALSTSAATIGTAVHALTERIDRGKPLGPVPHEAEADLKAYEEATKGIDWVGIEAFRVHDDWKIAGTADRVGYYNGRLTIFDIKTGSIDYPHKMAMQLAMYARSTPYDIPTDLRGEDPQPVSLNTGIIIHLPAGQGVCELHEFDIGKGWGACQLAKQVWDWRGVKDLTHPVNAPRVSTWEKSNGDGPIPTWETLIREQATLAGLRTIWARCAELGELTPQYKGMLTQRAQQIEAEK